MRCDVLVVGGGFGGAFAARELEARLGGERKVLLVSPTNFLLFSPLLPEAASGTLEPRHAVIPLRQLLRRTQVQIGTVTHLDVGASRATVTDLNGVARDVDFDRVLFAAGSVPTTFPIPGLIENAVGFKTLQDAIWLRNRVLFQLDAAAAEPDVERRRELLTFTFVGGGYAGVEALAELESLAADATKGYPSLARTDLRWVLIEAADTLLPGLHTRLADHSLQNLRRRGVTVLLGTRMTSCEDRVVRIDSDALAPFRSGTIVWTAGQRPNPVAERWGFPVDGAGAVPVDDHMRVVGMDRTFAIGDVAAVPDPDGGLSPNTAQHALRQARVAARNIAGEIDGGTPAVYDYRNRGLAVTLGKWQGAAQVKRITFTGPLAWWMGRSYHLLMMPGLARKARVVADWTLSLLFPRDIAQLGQLGSPARLDEG
jgi:NADH dehydrogenase